MAEYMLIIKTIETGNPIVDMNLDDESEKALSESLIEVLRGTCSLLKTQGTGWELLSHNILPAGNRLIISFLARH